MKIDFLLEWSHIWNNNASGIIFKKNISQSDIRLLNNNFTRNYGDVMHVEEICNAANIQMENNRFSHNQLSKRNSMNTVIGLRIMQDGQGNIYYRINSPHLA